MIDVTPTPELIAYLQADPMLAMLAPDGVWEDPAPQDRASRFVTLAFQTSVDQICGGGRRVTEFYYAAKVVGPAIEIVPLRQAAVRLDELLHFGPLVREALPGYNVLKSERTEAISYPDPEPVTGIRWEHRGGQYRIDVEAV